MEHNCELNLPQNKYRAAIFFNTALGEFYHLVAATHFSRGFEFIFYYDLEFTQFQSGKPDEPWDGNHVKLKQQLYFILTSLDRRDVYDKFEPSNFDLSKYGEYKVGINFPSLEQQYARVTLQQWPMTRVIKNITEVFYNFFINTNSYQFIRNSDNFFNLACQIQDEILIECQTVINRLFSENNDIFAQTCRFFYRLSYNRNGNRKRLDLSYITNEMLNFCYFNFFNKHRGKAIEGNATIHIAEIFKLAGQNEIPSKQNLQEYLLHRWTYNKEIHGDPDINIEGIKGMANYFFGQTQGVNKVIIWIRKGDNGTYRNMTPNILNQIIDIIKNLDCMPVLMGDELDETFKMGSELEGCINLIKFWAIDGYKELFSGVGAYIKQLTFLNYIKDTYNIKCVIGTKSGAIERLCFVGLPMLAFESPRDMEKIWLKVGDENIHVEEWSIALADKSWRLNYTVNNVKKYLNNDRANFILMLFDFNKKAISGLFFFRAENKGLQIKINKNKLSEQLQKNIDNFIKEKPKETKVYIEGVSEDIRKLIEDNINGACYEGRLHKLVNPTIPGFHILPIVTCFYEGYLSHNHGGNLYDFECELIYNSIMLFTSNEDKSAIRNTLLGLLQNISKFDLNGTLNPKLIYQFEEE